MSQAERRVLIADDEPAARLGVRQLLARYPDYLVIGECRNGIETLAGLRNFACDVLFLDIQMPGLDGFEVVERIDAAMPVVIFLTAHEEYALRGFEVQAFDYLVKPVTEARFAKTMARLERQFSSGLAMTPEAGLVVSTADSTSRLALTEIDWIEASGNYARIWTGKESMLLRESVQALEERLRAHGFCRVHRKALVRIEAVRRLAREGEGGVVAVLKSGVMVPVSRRLKADVLARLAL